MQRKDVYPRLSAVSFKILSIHTSESIVERYFSVVKNVITNDRFSLSADVMRCIAISRFYLNGYT